MPDLYWRVEGENVVLRDKGEGWTTRTRAIGDYRGGIIAMIPFSDEFSLAWANEIAAQIALGYQDIKPDSSKFEED